MIKYILAKIDSAELNFQCMTEKIQFEIEQEPSEDPTYPLGFTPLMFALWNGNFESIDLLIKHKVDTNIKTWTRDNIFHLVARKEFNVTEKVFQLLLENSDSNMLKLKNSKNETPITIMSESS